MFDVRHIRDNIVIPTLTALGLGWRQNDVDLMMGTGMQESQFTYRRQLGGGPALGLWQMEPFTHDDIWKTFLSFRKGLSQRVADIAGYEGLIGCPPAEWMVAKDSYACAMARIKYLRCPEPIPFQRLPTDVDGKDPYPAALGAYYVRNYNAGGKATVAEFVANWERLQHALAA